MGRCSFGTGPRHLLPGARSACSRRVLRLPGAVRCDPERVQPPLRRRRLRLAVAVSVTAVGGSLLMSAGTSSSATAPAPTPFVGPVATPPGPVPRPLVRTDGPLLPATGRSRLASVLAPMGPPATAPAAVGPAGLVGPGSPPAQVRTVQRLLNAGGAGLRVDGAWGPATSRAVRAAQERAGLPVDGRLGPTTLAVLRARR